MELKQFSGLANKSTPEALPSGALVTATNVDVDAAGKLRRRRGSTLIQTGGFHSLYADPDGQGGYVVKNGDLCRFTASMEFSTVFAGVGDAQLSYQRVADRVYAKSETHALVLMRDEQAKLWGVPHVPVFLLCTDGGTSKAGDYQVAVVYRRDSDGLEGGTLIAQNITLPTQGGICVSHIPNLAGHTASVYATTAGGENLCLVADGVTDSVTFSVSLETSVGVPLRTMGMTPPTGSGPLAWLLGRILIADRNVLWATDPYQYEMVDAISGFKMLDADITFLASMTDGAYIGTRTGVFFMAGPFESAQLTRLSTHGAPKQTPFQTDMAEVLKGDVPGIGMLFITDGGVCVGMNGGQIINLTNKTFEFPKAESVAVMVRAQDGINQFVGVASHPGTPTGSARFGDFVDAEIVRFRGV